jgi:hypothetical protein
MLIAFFQLIFLYLITKECFDEIQNETFLDFYKKLLRDLKLLKFLNIV